VSRSLNWVRTTIAGAEYRGFLANLATDAVAQAKLSFDRLSCGWAIGEQSLKQLMDNEFRERALSPGLDAIELRDLRVAHWRTTLDELLRVAGKSTACVASAPTDAPWKVEIAFRLGKIGFPYRWISEALGMRAPHIIRGLVFRFLERRAP